MNVASEMARLLNTRAFVDALPGFLLPDSANQARYALLRQRLDALAVADTIAARRDEEGGT